MPRSTPGGREVMLYCMHYILRAGGQIAFIDGMVSFRDGVTIYCGQ